MSKSLRTRRRQLGLTLVELMVAMVLGLVLMAGMLQLFAANKQTYQLSDEVSRMQEGARYALYLLERDIRMAGFLGCTGRDRSTIVINNKLSGAGTAFTPATGIEGWEASGTAEGSYSIIADATVSDASSGGWASGGSSAPALDGGTNSVANSDVVRVWHVDGDGALATVSGSTVTATTPPAYVVNDVMMLTNCTTVDIAQVCGLSGSAASLSCGANNSAALLNSDGAHAFKLAGWVYFVGKRGGVSTNPPALFRREISANASAGAAQELVEGVESLQLLYGEDTDTADPDGVADRYVTAANVSDWNNVVSVRVQLLMQSDRDDVVQGSQSFNFNGAAVTASDGRLRYPFVATVSVRNRSQ